MQQVKLHKFIIKCDRCLVSVSVMEFEYILIV